MRTPPSAKELEVLALGLRDACLANPETPDRDLLRKLVDAVASNDSAVAAPATTMLMRHVAEALSDRFEPALVDCYVRVFTEAIAAVQPVWSADFLRKRYQQLRVGSPPLSQLPIKQVFVLSRITLGADIAVTSVFLDAVLRRYPEARVWLAGPRKNYELFAGRPRVAHWPLDYPRGGTLRERLHAAEALLGIAEEEGALLVDPDSRITQLGLAPVMPAQRVLFFESRSAEAESERTLAAIAASFCFLRMGVPDARPFLAPGAQEADAARSKRKEVSAAPITISLGVGGNAAKGLSEQFEAKLLALLGSTGRPLWVDAGAGGEEAERVRRAIARSGLVASQVHVLDGSFAAFCAHIAEAGLYVGYDSAGQHAAAALGVPGITLFRGFVNRRMFARWRPEGSRSQVIPVEAETPETEVLDAVGSLLRQLLG